jgi:hypothetical protein
LRAIYQTSRRLSLFTLILLEYTWIFERQPPKSDIPNMATGGKDKGKKPLAVMNKYVYDAFLWTFSILVELFFREVHPRSSWKVPKEGPVIFVCAPHANQVAT